MQKVLQYGPRFKYLKETLYRRTAGAAGEKMEVEGAEPSGSSSAAAGVCEAAASADGGPPLSAPHQPRASIWRMLDDVLLIYHIIIQYNTLYNTML